FSQSLVAGPGIQPDRPNDNIVIFFRRCDAQNIRTLSQSPWRNAQRPNQRSFHEKEFPEICSVESYRPLKLHVALLNEQSLLGWVGFCLKAKLQFSSFRLRLCELLPFRLISGPQMMLFPRENLCGRRRGVRRRETNPRHADK